MDDLICPFSIEFDHIAHTLFSKSDFFEFFLKISLIIEGLKPVFFIFNGHSISLWLILLLRLLRLEIDDLLMMSFKHFEEVLVVIFIIDGNFISIFIQILQYFRLVHVE